MIKKILLLILCFNLFKTNADSPGNSPMDQNKVSFTNISRLSDYTFYWRLQEDSAAVFNRDSIFIIPGGRGAPRNAIFWGVNKKSTISTDTLSFSNYYSPDYVITVDTITAANKILYTKHEISNSNSRTSFGDNTNDAPRRSNKVILFSAISLVALVLLVWFFIRRKNKALNP